MRYTVPVVENNHCICPEENIRFEMDRWGVTKTWCVIHGEIPKIGKMEFDSKEAFEAWLKEH